MSRSSHKYLLDFQHSVSRQIKWMYEVYFRILRVPSTRNKNKQFHQGKILANYTCQNWMFVQVGECAFREISIGSFLWQLEYGCGP